MQLVMSLVLLSGVYDVRNQFINMQSMKVHYCQRERERGKDFKKICIIIFPFYPQADPEDALGKCQMWWCTAITLFMVLALEACITTYLLITATTSMQPISQAIFFLKLIFRLIAVTNVRKFMNNLKKAPPSSVHQKVYIRSKTIGPPPSNYIRY